MKKKFLILQARPDVVADYEYEAILKYGELDESDVYRIRMEEDGIPPLNVEHYAGVIVGGGPFNVSDDEAIKSEPQKRLEAQLEMLLKEIVEKDIPYMGACYGFGALAQLDGGRVSKEKYSEPVGRVEILLNREGQRDPLLEGLPAKFDVFAGHKEACQKMPDEAVLLGSSRDCPIHIFRIKENVYAVQFHPELDIPGIKKRIETYKFAGYFMPEEADNLKAMAEAHTITVPMKILKRFVERYKE
jgi:GMP synthase (glutamine-hydrolysing)